MIKKVKEGYRVLSESGRNMGTYPTKEEAKKRLQQIEFFKHKKQSQK
jgi:ribosomal protein S4E